MKAKVKSLGSVVDLSEYVYDEDGNEYTWDEVELIDDDKWQHYRIQAAIAAMQGQLANDESAKQMIETLDYASLPDKTKAYMNLVAQSSVMLADALVTELQKKGGQD